jgi:UDP-N-acetylmuramyl pentapeptide synthase
MLKTILGPSCHASKENENNEFGIPFTIMSMPKVCEYLVVECGARNPNDFNLISKYLFCDVFILTSIAENHLTTFGTVENIINTKMELKNCLRDKSNFIDGRSIIKESILEKNIEILRQTLRLLYIEMELDNIYFNPPSGRGSIIKKYAGQIIDQTYNAHPETVLATAYEQDANETILILGDMAELGSEEREIHYNLIKKLSKYEIFLTGDIYIGLKDRLENRKVGFFQNEQDFPNEYLSKQLKAGKKIYFKGSRSSKMERYLKILLDD